MANDSCATNDPKEQKQEGPTRRSETVKPQRRTVRTALFGLLHVDPKAEFMKLSEAERVQWSNGT